MIYTRSIANLSETEQLGRELGTLLFPGSVLALIGPMGVGKTHFTKAVASGMQVSNAALVNSPTFVLIQEYQARLPIYHFDAYRLNDWQEFAEIGSSEYFHGDGVCIIEWADRVIDALPAEYLKIEMSMIDAIHRKWIVQSFGSRHRTLLQQWFFPKS